MGAVSMAMLEDVVFTCLLVSFDSQEERFLYSKARITKVARWRAQLTNGFVGDW